MNTEILQQSDNIAPETSKITPIELSKTRGKTVLGSQAEIVTAGEIQDSDRAKRIIGAVVKHPAFEFTTKDGTPFYTKEKLKELYNEIAILQDRVQKEHQELPIPKRIETIIAEDEENYKFNSNYDDLAARTAHNLLCGEKTGSNCIGFAETCCILLNLNGIKAAPIISRLNKKNVACHYVTTYEKGDGTIGILDPERKRSCAEPEKQFNLSAYHASLRYATPDEDFCKIKTAKRAIGPIFDEFFAEHPEKTIKKPIDFINIEPGSPVDQRYHIFEEGTDPENPRLNLKESSMNKEKQIVIDQAISAAVKQAFAESYETIDQSIHQIIPLPTTQQNQNQNVI